MNERSRGRTGLSRRLFLGALGTGSVAIAGCMGGSGDAAADTPDDPDGNSDVPVRGDPDADVTLEVYEDFTCQACREYNINGYPVLAEEYLDPGLIRYEHRDFPFRNDAAWQASNAARAVYLADGNDAFWTYKSELFARQSELDSGPELLGEIASDLDLAIDSETVQAAATERPYDDTFETNKSRGEDAGVPGTPSFVLDGELVEADLRGQIDAAIGAADTTE